MVGIVIAFPGLVTSSLEKSTVDPSKVQIEIPTEEQTESPPDFGQPESEQPAGEPKPGADSADSLQRLYSK